MPAPGWLERALAPVQEQVQVQVPVLVLAKAKAKGKVPPPPWKALRQASGHRCRHRRHIPK